MLINLLQLLLGSAAGRHPVTSSCLFALRFDSGYSEGARSESEILKPPGPARARKPRDGDDYPAWEVIEGV